MKKISLYLSAILFIFFIIKDCGGKGDKYKCVECGKSFNYLPFQGIMGFCYQVPDEVHQFKSLDTYCSCECCTANRAKHGFRYNCH